MADQDRPNYFKSPVHGFIDDGDLVLDRPEYRRTGFTGKHRRQTGQDNPFPNMGDFINMPFAGTEDKYYRMSAEMGAPVYAPGEIMDKRVTYDDANPIYKLAHEDKYNFAMELLNFMNKEEGKPASPRNIHNDPDAQAIRKTRGGQYYDYDHFPPQKQQEMPSLPLPKAMESVLRERMQNPQIYLNLGEQQQDRRPFMAFDPNQ